MERPNGPVHRRSGGGQTEPGAGRTKALLIFVEHPVHPYELGIPSWLSVRAQVVCRTGLSPLLPFIYWITRFTNKEHNCLTGQKSN